MIAARFPDKVNSLVLAGAPIDTDAGNGPIKRMAHESQMSFYEELVGLGGGLMKGKFMLQGWKNMHPEQHYIQDQVDLYEHLDDPASLKKEETFEGWYENPIDLPGRWYLQVTSQLFKENRLAKGEFVGLGRRLDLKNISPALSTYSPSHPTTSRRGSRFLMPRNISARQKTKSKRSWFQAATSDCSWVRAP